MRLETERLILREWRDSDRAAYAEFNADPETRRFYEGVLTSEQTNAWIDGFIAELAQHGVGWLAVERKGDGAFLGDVGLSRLPQEMQAAIAGAPQVEVGWIIGRPYWGNGYAPEAAAACLQFGFDSLRLDEIVAFTFAGNHPSRRVMEKIGMRHEPSRDFLHPKLPDGHRLRPHVVYSAARP